MPVERRSRSRARNAYNTRRRRRPRSVEREVINVDSDSGEDVLIINEGDGMVLEIPTPQVPPTPPHSPSTPELVMRRNNSPSSPRREQQQQQQSPSTPPNDVLAVPPLPPLAPLTPPQRPLPAIPIVAANEEVAEVKTCLVCHDADGSVVRSCGTCNAETHQLCLDRWLLPRLERPTCPQCRSVLNDVDPQSVRQRMAIHQQEVVSK